MLPSGDVLAKRTVDGGFAIEEEIYKCLFVALGKQAAPCAITEFSAVVKILQGKCPEEEFEQIKKAVGLSIGRIQTEILDLITAAYPELDDLK